jgi:hypothetical protein
MNAYSRQGIAILKIGIVLACLAMGLFWPDWRVALAQVTYCTGPGKESCPSYETCQVEVTSDTRTGELLDDVRKQGRLVKEGQCVPTCLFTLSCLPDDSGEERIAPGGGVSGTAPVMGRAPQPNQEAPKPPAQPPQPSKTPKKANLVRVNVVTKGNLDLRKVAEVRRTLARELTKIFGENNFELKDEVSKGKRDFTIYLVDGDEPPDSLLGDHGIKETPETRDKLKKAFTPGEEIHGVNVGNVSIIPWDKTIANGGYTPSNTTTHELGHALGGPLCNHPRPGDPVPGPECGGVMVESPSPAQDLGFTPGFISIVKDIYQLLVTDIPRYTAVWEPGTEGEIQLYGWTEGDVRAKYDYELRRDGWRIKLLNPYVVDGDVRYVAVFVPKREITITRQTRGDNQKTIAPEMDEIYLMGQSYENYLAQYDKLWKQGYRLKLLRPYVINNQLRFTAVWEPSTEGEIQIYGWGEAELRARYDQLWPQGWRLKVLSPYVQSGEVRYVAAFKPSQEDEIQVYGWKYEDYRTNYDKLWTDGWRLRMLNPYRINNETRYTAVWQRSTEGEIQVYDWYYEDYRANYDNLWSYGWRLKLLEAY